MPPMIRRNITLGVVIGSRALFSPAPCKAARDEVLAHLARLGIDGRVICLPNFGDEIAIAGLVNRWSDDTGCDASAIRCWRSLQGNFGCATCLTMRMMGEDLMPSS